MKNKLAQLWHETKQYYKVWVLYGKLSLELSFVNRFTLIFFFLGKVVRYATVLIVLFVLRNTITSVAGYTVDQMIVFFLVYQTVDSLAQIFFRGIYEFGEKVRTGSFDFDLLKPINSLFRSLLGNPDLNDVAFALPTFLLNIFIISRLDLSISMGNIGWFLFLLANGVLIAAAFHVLVLAAAILIVEIDNVVWLYRDLSRLGQIPVTLHLEGIRWLLLFVFPIGIMMTIPAEALMGIPPTLGLLTVLAVSWAFLGASLYAWRAALRRYTGASS